MIVGRALARWTRGTNRRRALELVTRVLPWLAAFAIAAVWVGSWIAIAVASALGVAVLVLAARRTTWHAPATFARSLDATYHTHDLLQTAFALEHGPAEALGGVIATRAHALIDTIAREAVPPARLRPSPLGVVAAGVAASLLLLLGAGGIGAVDGHKLGDRERAQLDQIGGALDELEHDESLPADVRAKLEKAKKSLRSARESASGTAALAAMSEAQELLDQLAPQMKKADDPRNLGDNDLAEKLAQAVKNNDAAQIDALSREAMRRANLSDAAAEAMANAMKRSALNASGADPWNSPQFPNTPAGQRLSQLAQAGQQLGAGERDASKQTLETLAQAARTASGAGTRDSRGRKLDEARRALASLRSMQRSALNGGSQTAKADAARAAAGKPGTGSGNAGSGDGQGSGEGSGRGMGRASGPVRPGSSPGSGAGPQGNAMSVLGTPGSPGASGTSGARANTPSGATREDVAAEEVTGPPPLSAEGVIRAIAEHSNGIPGARRFGPVRDHYAAIAEAVIRRDEIPLTRRDFIQRYFEALRNHEAK
jgi:hypothetical protein